MTAQRIVQQSLRRHGLAVVVALPNTAFSKTTVGRLAAPSAAVSGAQHVRTRPFTTERLTSSAAHSILAEQRKCRPVAPHLSIYRPQITWYGSALNRISGSLLSGSLYLFATAYLVAPLFGWHLESQSIAAAFATWPVAAKVATKYFVSLPFTYHSWNGIRHLVWDTGKELLNKQVIRSGWAVVGLSVASSVALSLI